jgi:aspartyl-tRNA(Asn)/glutamyl-tRNA(Gln) amidotransferase subunit B
MTKILDGGPGEIVQETRGWDEVKQATFSQRKKESAHDYRYFPDPDLPKLKRSEIPEFSDELLKASMPELPWEKRARLVSAFGIKPENAAAFTADIMLGKLFEDTAAHISKDAYGLLENYITSDIAGIMKSKNETSLGKIEAESFAKLMGLVKDGKLSSRGAKDILLAMYEEGGDAEAIANARGLFQVSDEGALKTIVAEVIAANPTVAADYKAGKVAVMQFLVGQAMKASKGSGNPATLKTLLEEALKV